MSEFRVDRSVHEGTHEQPEGRFWYAPSGPGPAVVPAVAEPPPPEQYDGTDAADPAARLARCLNLQAKAISLLEGERSAFLDTAHPTRLEPAGATLALLKEAVRHGRELGQDIRALQNEIESLRSERDGLAVALRQAEALSLSDDLTGLPNRRAFLQRLDQELSRSQRTGQPLSVVLLDLDNFKDINDRFGHHIGDQVLHCFAQRITQEFRQHDLSARYGGEEFVLLFPVTWQDEARNALEKLRRQIRRDPLDVGGACVGLPTFSAGIAGLRSGESAVTLLNRADQALYRAKRLGRNRTETDEPLPPRPDV
ncbi:MAG: GGDEF domain-containing protein [Pseudomonadota bacterium]